MAVPGLLPYLFTDMADTKAFLLPPSLHTLLPFPDSDPVLVPAPVPVPVWRSSYYFHPRSRSRPDSAPVPLPFFLRSLAFSPVPGSAPFLSPLQPPNPFPFPFSFAPFRPSDLVTPSVHYACTVTGPCDRICRVPTKAAPCLQR